VEKVRFSTDDLQSLQRLSRECEAAFGAADRHYKSLTAAQRKLILPAATKARERERERAREALSLTPTVPQPKDDDALDELLTGEGDYVAPSAQDILKNSTCAAMVVPLRRWTYR
jgi:hypothetical protein